MVDQPNASRSNSPSPPIRPFLLSFHITSPDHCLVRPPLGACSTFSLVSNVMSNVTLSSLLLSSSERRKHATRTSTRHFPHRSPLLPLPSLLTIESQRHPISTPRSIPRRDSNTSSDVLPPTRSKLVGRLPLGHIGRVDDLGQPFFCSSFSEGDSGGARVLELAALPMKR